jgi:hypothetical protein
MVEVFQSMIPDQVAEMMGRRRLLFSVPELRPLAINEMIRSGRMVTDELAERLGRPSDDFELRIFAGAVLSAVMAALIPMLDDGSIDMLTQMDRAFEFVEKGSRSSPFGWLRGVKSARLRPDV